VQQPADAEDFEKTLRFVEYVMNESRLYLAGFPPDKPGS
jgi:hypothetical protein